MSNPHVLALGEPEPADIEEKWVFCKLLTGNFRLSVAKAKRKDAADSKNKGYRDLVHEKCKDKCEECLLKGHQVGKDEPVGERRVICLLLERQTVNISVAQDVHDRFTTSWNEEFRRLAEQCRICRACT